MGKIILLILGFLLFWNLGGTYLTNWDEAWYADIARNMVETGNMITPVWNHQPFFDKPPLYFWVSTLAFKIFGTSEFSARFFSAISGLGVGLLVYFLAKTLFHNKSIGVLSLVVLSSSMGFLYRARTGNLDVFLTFWILLSIFSFYKGYINKKHWWFIILGISIGLGFLTKGAISFTFPIVAILYLAFNRDFKILKLPPFSRGVLLGIIISALWILTSALINGQQFIADFLLNQTGKLTTTLYFWQHFSFDYIAYLKSGLKLWFILFIPSFIHCLYRWRNTNYLIVIVYFLLIFTILSFSENKSNWFLLPLYPLISIMIGYSLYEGTKKFLGQKFIPLVTLIIIGVAVFQNTIYRNEYLVPDIAGDEVRVALAAKKLTEENDVLYLTNYYYPTIVYYSERKTYAIYSEHEWNASWWIKPKTDWKTILQSERVFIITTNKELENLKEYFSRYKFDILYQSGEKLLLKRV